MTETTAQERLEDGWSPARRRAEELVTATHRAFRSTLPTDTVVLDVHTHLGVDEDGTTLAVDRILEGMAAYDVEGAFVFALNDPEREPNYTLPNDRILEWAGRSDGRLVPFVRLDLQGDPVAEARRAIAAGARGIKLHPRAQRFSVDDARLDHVFGIAEEQHLPVLIHAGRGMPPITRQLERVVDRHPGARLILAHAAIIDQPGIFSAMSGRPNVFFDTSTWGVFDMLSLFEGVAPEQVLFASDVPYGYFATAIPLLAAVLEHVGATPEVRRKVMGGTAQLLIDGELPTLSAPIGSGSYTEDVQRLRATAYLGSAIPLVMLRLPDRIGLIGLALPCYPEDDPCVRLLGACNELWLEGLDDPVVPGVEHPGRTVGRLLGLAQIATLLPRSIREGGPA